MKGYSLVFALVIFLVVKGLLVYYSNSLGDNLLADKNKFDDKTKELLGLKAIKDSIFKMHSPSVMDTIKTVDNLKAFIKTQDEKIQKGIDELTLINTDKDWTLRKMTILNSANVVNNGLIILATAILIIGQVKKRK